VTTLQSGFTLKEPAGSAGSAGPAGLSEVLMTGPEIMHPSGFDTRADRHTRHTARLGGLDDFPVFFPVFDFCVFHDFTPPFLS
jgi:hypothetical protein